MQQCSTEGETWRASLRSPRSAVLSAIQPYQPGAVGISEATNKITRSPLHTHVRNQSITLVKGETDNDALAVAHQAAEWHVEQRRKGEAKEPYVNHLLEVAVLVASAGASEDAICAALLHDAIEDQKIPAKVIEGLFGAAVAGVVCEVTDAKTKSKEERKELQITHAPTLSPGAKLIKLADKISNLIMNSLASSPPVEWTQQRRRNYVEWCQEFESDR
jgi:GTP diphosphokinase / guanosine-3',5'-bis(diphosphate) 3'-diphosphatase